MARKNPLSERDRQICARVREVRKGKRLSQVAFAEMLGIDSSLLASYEHARVPIRYEFADRFCAVFRVCQRWLAEGIEPRRVYVPIPEDIHQKTNERALFSEVYDQFLKEPIGRYFSNPWQWGRDIGVLVESEFIEEIFSSEQLPINRDEFFYFLLKILRPALEKNAPANYGELYRNIYAAIRAFRSEYEPTQKRDPHSLNRKEALTDVSLKSKTASMKSEMQKLLEKVKSKASRPGGKSQLANELGVAPARVSEWLSGKKEPGGEYTLRLLKWVES